jgi:hypothetical protein
LIRRAEAMPNAIINDTDGNIISIKEYEKSFYMLGK